MTEVWEIPAAKGADPERLEHLERQRAEAAGRRAALYRGAWHIWFDPPPIPIRSMDWHFMHDDFDGADDSMDNRCGHAPTAEACRAAIDEIEDEG